MLFILRFVATVLLMMFAFPALGLVQFDGGIGLGLGASALVAVIGTVVAIVSLPLLLTFGVGALLAGAATGGQLGVRLVGFGLGTAINAATLGLVAWMLAGVTLIGFWPTIGAAAILALVQTVLTSHSTQSE